MEILSTILTVTFVIVCLLLIVIILLQSNRSAGMGLFGGGAQSAFGASSGDIMTKLTSGLAAAFMILALVIAMIKTSGSTIEDVQEEMQKGEMIEKTSKTNGGVNTEPAKNSESAEPKGKSGQNQTTGTP